MMYISYSRVSSYRAFTMIELLIAVGIISSALVTVVLMIRHSVTFVEKSKHEVVAIWLAKEGMEIVSSIRHTNRIRWSSKKNTCWLQMDPKPYLTGIASSSQCTNSDDTWMTWWIYSIQPMTVDNQRYYRLVSSTWEIISLSWGTYLRKIIGMWLYDKIAWGVLICDYGQTPWCNTDAPKEYRYCVDVSYTLTASGSVRLCSVLTNYQN